MSEQPSSAVAQAHAAGFAVVRAAGRTDLGTRHQVNEDSFAVVELPTGASLLALCDGMGGMGAGDEASRAALEVLIRRLSAESAESVRSEATSAIEQADLALMHDFASTNGRKPGSTCACVILRNDAEAGPPDQGASEVGRYPGVGARRGLVGLRGRLRRPPRHPRSAARAAPVRSPGRRRAQAGKNRAWRAAGRAFTRSYQAPPAPSSRSPTERARRML